MTATIPAPAATAPAGTRAAPAAPRRSRRLPLVRALRTPDKLWALLAGLLALSVAWGVIGGLVANQHSSAADSVATVNERNSLNARHMYQAIADADATITAAFLASPTPPLDQLQRYQADVENAQRDLSGLQAAGGNPATTSALASLSGGLSAYTGFVGEAAAEYADGHPLTGGSFLQVASERAHLVLLPAANTAFTQENAALGAASGRATGFGTMIGILILAVVTGIALYRAQRWLYRRTNRVFSPGLVFASVALFASVVWIVAAFLGGRSDLDRGIGRGSAPAQNLALASIGAQQIRGDAVLNVISRSGTLSFSDDFALTSKAVNTWLGDAAAAQDAGGQGPALVAAAQREVAAWETANKQVYVLDKAANYAGERDIVVENVPGTTVTGYNALEGDFNQAIAADQAVFTSAAANSASALDPLTTVVATASAAMAAGCYLAVSRRLREYA